MLKPSEQGSKCKIHEVFYETEEFRDGKTRQYCPKCEEERYTPFLEQFTNIEQKTKQNCDRP